MHHLIYDKFCNFLHTIFYETGKFQNCNLWKRKWSLKYYSTKTSLNDQYLEEDGQFLQQSGDILFLSVLTNIACVIFNPAYVVDQ